MNISNASQSMSISKRKALIAKGIEQAWDRRFSDNIHSGVRVKIRQKSTDLIHHYQLKSSSFDRTNRMESMLKHLWIESETSALCKNGQNSIAITNSSLERTHNPSADVSLTSYQTKPISLKDNNCRQSLDIIQKDIGMQTTTIMRIDRQTSCDIIMPTSMVMKKNRKSRISSSSSDSKISVSEDIEDTDSTSTETSTASSSTTARSETNDNYTRYRRNKNRNNNAIDDEIDCKDNQIENSIKHLPVIMYYFS
jgi:hypothetical protein